MDLAKHIVASKESKLEHILALLLGIPFASIPRILHRQGYNGLIRVSLRTLLQLKHRVGACLVTIVEATQENLALTHSFYHRLV
jgi:hypothetical protein